MSAPSDQIVYVVDDDVDVRESLKWLLESVGLRVDAYADAQAFLDAYPTGQSGCIVLDVRMPGMSGLNLQQLLPAHQIELPVIMISAHGDIDMAVSAMTEGALTFIEKPFKDQLLLDQVQKALEIDQSRRLTQDRRRSLEARMANLTRREREVMLEVAKGLSNKEIAEKLQVARKTVEGHRANVMSKMQVESLSELIQIAIALGLLPEYTADH